jgi:glucosamine-phosphate N-acetyltransferase
MAALADQPVGQSPVGAAEGLVIREMYGTDLTPEFLDTLASLAEARLSLAQALEIFRKRIKDGLRTYIAVWDRKVVGTATLLVEQKFLHSGGLVGHIEDVAVHRYCQGRGIGRALVRRVTEEAKRLGCYKVILNCYETVAPFYERLGYHKHDLGLRMDCRAEAAAGPAPSLVSQPDPALPGRNGTTAWGDRS